MDGTTSEDDDDEDIKLMQASAALLADLEHRLPMLLWKPAHRQRHKPRCHGSVKKGHLDHIVQLIEPFQAEPQLLDAKLKYIVPPIVQAYLDFLLEPRPAREESVSLETAACTLLYTLCKVRGYKIVVGFLNNEPRYLEPILEALERAILLGREKASPWQVPYVLLLWLSHLLLTPFDLGSISAKPGPILPGNNVETILVVTPPLIARVLRVGLAYNSTSTKAQGAAAAMLIRLVIRPDVQQLGVADSLIRARLPELQSSAEHVSSIYELLGTLRLISGATSSTELVHLVPSVYNIFQHLFDELDDSSLLSNAVAKKLSVKIFRNIAITSLHSMSSDGPLIEFVQSTDVLENVIDYLLRYLGDKDTPVRYAAAKAISLIVLELDPSMAQQIIQAILDSLKDDIPRSASAVDFTTVNALRWHGLTLALSHTLFKRSAAPDQLKDILDALISALQFQQRTATGSTLGTNVRDAANFGTWSLSRRYTTAELLSISPTSLSASVLIEKGTSIVQVLAGQLILSACLDPAGNIRRGSSAALQELVGRHPDQVYAGIALVQTVDYLAVSLRNRAMIDVANKAAALNSLYWQAILEALFEWRGLGSADVASREAAATSIARLSAAPDAVLSSRGLPKVIASLRSCSRTSAEGLHGLALAAAMLLEFYNNANRPFTNDLWSGIKALLEICTSLNPLLEDFSPRMVRSEFTAAFARLLTALCNLLVIAYNNSAKNSTVDGVDVTIFDEAVDRLLARREDSVVQTVPNMVRALYRMKCAGGAPFSCIELQNLSKEVVLHSSKGIRPTAGRAIALGTLVPICDQTEMSTADAKEAIAILSGLLSSLSIEWRITGAKALLLAVDGSSDAERIDASTVQAICSSIHQGLNDYTIDERGDIGSLVRLQCIACVMRILAVPAFHSHRYEIQTLEGDILRLSLEKLDRVRFQAAQCRKSHLDLTINVPDISSVSSPQYFEAALAPLTSPTSTLWTQRALLEGMISSAGISAEPLLQASRHVLAFHLSSTSPSHLQQLLEIYVDLMKTSLLSNTANTTTHPALEVLSFLLTMQIPQRLLLSSHSPPTFKWRNLLSTIQKSHHKSNDIPKILAAVRVYTGLAEVPSIRDEVLKKMVGMLRTNPYPHVRAAVAEGLWVVTGDEALRECDWTASVAQHGEVVEGLRRRHGV